MGWKHATIEDGFVLYLNGIPHLEFIEWKYLITLSTATATNWTTFTGEWKWGVDIVGQS